MTEPKRPLLPWLRPSKIGQSVLLALTLGLTVGGYFVGQVVAAFLLFFTLGSGEGHRDAGLLVQTGCLALQVGLGSWLYWRGLRGARWGLWAVNSGVSLALFAYYVVYPWYGSPRDPTYQTYIFTRGTHHYELTLAKPGNWFNVSDVTFKRSGTTTSLMMGDYTVRHDTVFLQEWQGPRQWLLYRQTLVGFENTTGPISLSTRE
jgi:hypothetical protein